MKIAESARKHGVADEDMLHAVRNAIVRWGIDDDVQMFVGPALNAELLEVAVLYLDPTDPLIIHAMPARRRYLP